MSYFNYTYLISSLLDPRLVDPGLTLIHVAHTILLVRIKLAFFMWLLCQRYMGAGSCRQTGITSRGKISISSY